MKKNPFDNLLSLKEASILCGVDESTLRKAIASNVFKENEEVKKFGKQWVITKKALEKAYNKQIKKEKQKKEKESILENQLIFETINKYSLKYKINKKYTIELFVKKRIIEHLLNNYSYYHLQGTEQTIDDIHKIIKK